MRLTDYQRNSIKEAVHQYLPDARVFLYGSRVDDTKRGGDIDLLVLTDHDGAKAHKYKMLLAMFDKIGEQRIDLLVERDGALSNFASMVMDEAKPL